MFHHSHASFVHQACFGKSISWWKCDQYFSRKRGCYLLMSSALAISLRLNKKTSFLLFSLRFLAESSLVQSGDSGPRCLSQFRVWRVGNAHEADLIVFSSSSVHDLWCPRGDFQRWGTSIYIISIYHLLEKLGCSSSHLICCISPIQWSGRACCKDCKTYHTR